MGLRKPHATCFEKALTEQQFNPKETLFIDDSIQHIEGAKGCGIKAVLFLKMKLFKIGFRHNSTRTPLVDLGCKTN